MCTSCNAVCFYHVTMITQILKLKKKLHWYFLNWGFLSPTSSMSRRWWAEIKGWQGDIEVEGTSPSRGMFLPLILSRTCINYSFGIFVKSNYIFQLNLSYGIKTLLVYLIFAFHKFYLHNFKSGEVLPLSSWTWLTKGWWWEGQDTSQIIMKNYSLNQKISLI